MVRIGDFGSTRRVARTDMTHGVGTPGYAAPEDLVGMPTDISVDVWSVGVMFREMLIGCRVWQAAEPGPCGTMIGVVGVMEPPPADVESVPGPLRPYVAAYSAWEEERGGTLDTWAMYNRRHAQPDPGQKHVAGLMLQLSPSARPTAGELMNTDFVRQARGGRKREWVKVHPPTYVPPRSNVLAARVAVVLHPAGLKLPHLAGFRPARRVHHPVGARVVVVPHPAGLAVGQQVVVVPHPAGLAVAQRPVGLVVVPQAHSQRPRHPHRRCRHRRGTCAHASARGVEATCVSNTEC